MYKKKLLKGCLVATLAIAMVATSMSPVLSNGAAVVQAAETKTVVLNFWDVENNKQAAEVEMEVPVDAIHVNTGDMEIPEGYELAGTTMGDLTINDGYVWVEVKPAATKTVTLNFWDVENNKQAAEVEMEVPADAIHVNTGDMEIPEGYELAGTTMGDLTINDGYVWVEVKPVVAENDIIKAVFVDENNNSLGVAGDYFVTVDDTTGNFKYSDLAEFVPEGYELVYTGDCAYVPSTEGTIEIPCRKIQTSTIVKVQFVDESGYVLGGGDYFVNENDGNFNYADLSGFVPAGYKMTVSGDCSVADGTNGNIIKITVVPVATKVNVQFVDAAGNVIGGGDCFVDQDGDGIFKYDELASIVPAGYKMTVSGDCFVSEGTIKVNVEKINKGIIINVTYTDPQGNDLGGGDYVVDLDGDGIANYSELALPVGYKLSVVSET